MRSLHFRHRRLGLIVASSSALLASACAPASLQPTVRTATVGTGPASPHPLSTDDADALDLAGRYVEALCQLSWLMPYDVWRRRAAAYLTPTGTAALSPLAADRADWHQTVVRQRVSSDCQILDDQILREAPNTAARRYVRVVARRSLSRPGHPPVLDEPEYGLVLVRTGGRWLVDRPSYGG
jgi:hypothetical protein